MAEIRIISFGWITRVSDADGFCSMTISEVPGTGDYEIERMGGMYFSSHQEAVSFAVEFVATHQD